MVHKPKSDVDYPNLFSHVLFIFVNGHSTACKEENNDTGSPFPDHSEKAMYQTYPMNMLSLSVLQLVH